MKKKRRIIRKLLGKRDEARELRKRLDDHGRQIKRLVSLVEKLINERESEGVTCVPLYQVPVTPVPAAAPFQLFTRLQDGGWELHTQGELSALKKEARKMHKGPLGTSCMYQIVNKRNEVVFQL